MFESSSIQSFLASLTAYQMSWKDVGSVKKSTKVDSTPVTEIDQGISDFFKNHSLAKGMCFYSEEEHCELHFPALILDPLDGTKEFIQRRPECAVSAAWMTTPSLDSESFALIQNPFTGFCITSLDLPSWRPQPSSEVHRGLVSRSEWERGLFAKNKSDEFQVSPRGSIAFKLGLLSSGACDFVVSLRPKNIWDIAAGTLLAHQREMEFWSAGKKVTELNQKTFGPPLFWAPPELIKKLISEFSL